MLAVVRDPPVVGPAATSAVPRVTPRLPPSLRVIPDETRNMMISCWATRGAGKSQLLGRLIAWQDFFRGVPLVVLDPIGGTIDHLLDKINRRPYRERTGLWTRIRYVNMNGQDGRVIGWPVFHRGGNEQRLAAASQHYLDVLTRADPDLARAPIQGLNALAPLASAAGIILTGLGLGITEAWSLISEPARWEPRLARLATEYPETAGAIAELRSVYGLSPREREARTATFKSKLSLFRFAPNFRAVFGAREPGIRWREVVKYRQAVLLDFRDIHSPAVKKFCLLWVYDSLVSFIKQRGHGRHIPLSLIIDELTYLVGTAAMNTDLLTADLDELINRISRSHTIWLTLAGQELFQLPEQLRQTVLSAGTVLLGQTSDYQTAEELARRYYRYDPYRVKKREPIQGVVEEAGARYPHSPARHGTVGYRTTEFTRNEQDYLHSRSFLELPAFHFLLGTSAREGQLPTDLQRISTARLDAGQFPTRQRIDRIRSQLMRRDGVSEQVLLAEIEARMPAVPGRIGPDPKRQPTTQEAPSAASPSAPERPQASQDKATPAPVISRHHPDEK